MLKAMFEQFVSEYEIYPYQTYSEKSIEVMHYICRSDINSLVFSIEIDSAFPYRWTDIIDLVNRNILHVRSIKVF